MDIIGWSIKRPVGITVGVILVVMFGLIGLGAIPIQLTPTVDRPLITVTTSWPGRSPQEVVDEITKVQEEELKNVSNLKSMRSSSNEGAAEITLEFYIGTDLTRALQQVSDALRQVPDYPDEVEEPQIKTAEGGPENAIAWIIIDLDEAGLAAHRDFDITTLLDALDKEIKPYLERVDGVAEVNIYGGREREVRVLVDPAGLAQRDLNVMDVLSALRAENRNTSAGTVAEGKRDLRIRVVGQFLTEGDVLGAVVAYRDGRPVYVRDVASVEISHEKVRGFVRTMGHPCLAMNVIRQANSNVVRVMADLRDRLDEVRTEILPRLDAEVGPHLQIRQVYDETTYIDSAIDLVLGNLWLGGSLAALVLLLFLRTVRATLVIVLAIPISVIGTFLVMVAFGRTLNVISLAGLAFATGMVVDNAVVVLENIVRRRQLGDEPFRAADRGAREVWGAILASTLTTVAVFIPVLTIREEAGQLFADIALAIAVAVSLSLIVSITVVPSAAARMVTGAGGSRGGPIARAWTSLFGLAPLATAGTTGLAAALRWCMSGWRAWTVRPALIVALMVASLAGSVLLRPPLDYLPTGNRNLVFGGLNIPPGYSVDQMRAISERLEAGVGEYVRADINDPASVAALPPVPRFDSPVPFDPVPIENFFIGSFNGSMFVGATSQDPQRVIPIGYVLTNAMFTVPDSYGGAFQAGIFSSGFRGGNSVNVEIAGPDLDRVIAAAQRIFGLANERFGAGFGGVQAEPSNYNLSQQEWRLEVSEAGREMGITAADLGTVARGLVDGAFVDDFRLGADTVDLVVAPADGAMAFKEEMRSIPVRTPMGRVVPLDTVATFSTTRAPQSILRVEELPAVSISIRIPTGLAVDDVVAVVRGELIPAAEREGLIDRTMRVRMEGNAAKLDEVRASLFGAASTGPEAPWQRVLRWAVYVLGAAGILAGVATLTRPGKRGSAAGAAGVMLLVLVVGGLFFGIAAQPQLVTARFVWALAVTYLLMAALYESFLYPLVIMFSVPLAVVGGFAALRLVHNWTLSVPTIAPQQLDVVTMLGFVILIGTVVNNAILLVEQALNFMRPSVFGDTTPPLDARAAVAESVRTRVRPIFMTTLTTIGGQLPLVVAPGAGSEMYRGLGAVVLGGLLVSTFFTLVLVPLAFSLVVEMKQGFAAAWARRSTPAPVGAAPSVA